MCAWPKSPADIHYHDHEWGVPLHDDRGLFEFLILDAFQAGLSWATILRKRESFRRAFEDFDPEKIAAYGPDDIERLMNDAGIIRNRLKVNAAVTNARRFLEISQKHGSFDAYIWQFTDGKTLVNRWTHTSQVPATSPESDLMSKTLKKDGFKFVGSTICYAFMQAAGMVNDHLVHCHRYEPLVELAKKGGGIHERA